MKKVCAVLVVILLLGVGLSPFGFALSEVPTPGPAEFVGDASPAAGWFWQFLVGPIGVAALGILAKVVQFVDKWLTERTIIKESLILQKCYRFVAYGVDQTWKHLVRELKAGLEDDGKLSEEDKNRALVMARETAVAYAKSYGFDLLKTIGPEMIELLIEKVIGDRKAGTVVLDPLSDFPDLLPSST